MKPSVRNKYVKALRSKKYKQCYEALHKDGAFCALGVLVDIYAKEHRRKWRKEIDGAYSIMGEAIDLPPEVSEWSGCSDDLVNAIMSYNDINRLSFDEIAALIRSNIHDKRPTQVPN